MTVTAPQRVQRHGTRSRYAAGCRCDPCRDAAAAYRVRYRKARAQVGLSVRGRPFTTEPRLPAQPLLDAIYAHLTEHDRKLETLGRAVAQAMRRAACTGTISCYAADRLAVRVLRRHPAELYGPEWYVLGAADGD